MHAEAGVTSWIALTTCAMGRMSVSTAIHQLHAAPVTRKVNAKTGSGNGRMTSKDAARLYINAGFTPPPEIAAPNTEHIRNTRRKIVEGVEFRSTLEATAYQILRGWERAGAISNLKLQPRYLLQAKMRCEGKAVRAIEYVADFEFVRDGRTIVVDAKGYRTPMFSVKKKLFIARYPDLVFKEWSRQDIREMGGS